MQLLASIGGAVLGTAGAGLMISSMGVLSSVGGGPINVNSDMNISNTLNISNINNSFLICYILDCKNYSILIFHGWKNDIINISNTSLTSDSGLYTHLYGGVPSDGYVRNNVHTVIRSGGKFHTVIRFVWTPLTKSVPILSTS